MEEHLLKAGELAVRLGVSRGSVYKMVAKGVIPVVSVGASRGAVRFSLEDVILALSKSQRVTRPYHPPCQSSAEVDPFILTRN